MEKERCLPYQRQVAKSVFGVQKLATLSSPEVRIDEKMWKKKRKVCVSDSNCSISEANVL